MTDEAKVEREAELVREVVKNDVAYAQTCLEQEWTYDNLKDAADALYLAANRMKPDDAGEAA